MALTPPESSEPGVQACGSPAPEALPRYHGLVMACFGVTVYVAPSAAGSPLLKMAIPLQVSMLTADREPAWEPGSSLPFLNVPLAAEERQTVTLPVVVSAKLNWVNFAWIAQPGRMVEAGESGGACQLSYPTDGPGRPDCDRTIGGRSLSARAIVRLDTDRPLQRLF